MVFGKLKTYLAVAGAMILAIVAAYFKGRKAQSDIDHGRELNEYVETRRRMDENTIPSDSHAAAEWLRKRSESGGGM